MCSYLGICDGWCLKFSGKENNIVQLDEKTRKDRTGIYCKFISGLNFGVYMGH